VSYSTIDDFDIYHWVVLSKKPRWLSRAKPVSPVLPSCACRRADQENQQQLCNSNCGFDRPSKARRATQPPVKNLLENYNMGIREACHM
jgi:hypothetical protein